MAKTTEVKNLPFGSVFILASDLANWMRNPEKTALVLHEKSIRPSFDKNDPGRKTPRNYRWAWVKDGKRVSLPPDTLVIPCKGKMTYDCWSS